jgi:regulator of CtrA degradation
MFINVIQSSGFFEWLLSTLFDASLLDFRAAAFRGSFFGIELARRGVARQIACSILTGRARTIIIPLPAGPGARQGRGVSSSMTDRDSRHMLSQDDRLIDFMAHFASSEQFQRVFQEGMSLVEETANYLDGPGRQDARGLDRHGAIAYATESMRLTTRLMQLASWLLLQRAVSAGELSKEAALAEKHRINLSEIGPGHKLSGEGQLPEGLMGMIERSLKLHQRVFKLDAMIHESCKDESAATNPVASQVDQLAEAFSAVKRRAR